jgi:TolB-like protein
MRRWSRARAFEKRAAAAADTQKSIAVLPFCNMSADPEQELQCFRAVSTSGGIAGFGRFFTSSTTARQLAAIS